MPTHDRRPFGTLPIEYFLRQDCFCKELIIIDDGDDPIGDPVPDCEGMMHGDATQSRLIAIVLVAPSPMTVIRYTG